MKPHWPLVWATFSRTTHISLTALMVTSRGCNINFSCVFLAISCNHIKALLMSVVTVWFSIQLYIRALVRLKVVFIVVFNCIDFKNFFILSVWNLGSHIMSHHNPSFHLSSHLGSHFPGQIITIIATLDCRTKATPANF